MEKKPFSELTESRKYSVVHQHIEDNWYETTMYELEVDLEKLGFSDPRIQFSGFHSQGDGASFTSNMINLKLFLKKEKSKMDFDFKTEKIIDGWSESDLDTFGLIKPSLVEGYINEGLYYATVDRIDHRYSHENTVEVNLEVEDITIIKEGEDAGFVPYQMTKEDCKQVENFQDYLQTYLDKWVKNKCRSIYNRLEEIWNQEVEGWYHTLNELNTEWPTTE
jgi:hypothetical protein